MNSALKNETVPTGWQFGGMDDSSFPGIRICPIWQGALEGKILICQDIRVLNGEYLIFSPWKEQVIANLGSDIATVEAYVLEHGKVTKPGANVWD